MRIDESGQNPTVLANLDEAVSRQVAADPAQQLLRGRRIDSFEMGDEAFAIDACQVEHVQHTLAVKSRGNGMGEPISEFSRTSKLRSTREVATVPRSRSAIS